MKPSIVLLVALLLAACLPDIPGNESTDTAAAERKRLARRDLAPSPMPKAMYGPREKNLVHPAVLELDEQLRPLVRTYRASDAEKRTSMRDSISAEEISTLLTFAGRAAAIGMRERDPSWIEDGLGALAMADADRVSDMGLLSVTIALLYHAGVRADADPRRMFVHAAGLAHPRIGETLRTFPDVPAEEKDVRVRFYEDVGTGFIGRGIEPYAPAHNLTSASIAIAAVIDADRYAVEGIFIADTVPGFWIRGAGPLLERASGVTSINTNTEQAFTVYLVEVPDAAAATALRDAANREEAKPNSAMVGIARGNLFCLVKAGTLRYGETIDETPQTLQRFVAPIERVLEETL